MSSIPVIQASPSSPIRGHHEAPALCAMSPTCFPSKYWLQTPASGYASGHSRILLSCGGSGSVCLSGPRISLCFGCSSSWPMELTTLSQASLKLRFGGWQAPPPPWRRERRPDTMADTKAIIPAGQSHQGPAKMYVNVFKSWELQRAGGGTLFRGPGLVPFHVPKLHSHSQDWT